EWGLKPQGFNIKFLAPKGFVEEYEKVGVKVDKQLTISYSDLTAQDWAITFNFSLNEPEGIVIERALKAVRKRFGPNYTIDDIIGGIEEDKRSEKAVKNKVINRFLAAEDWGIFEKKGTPVRSLFSPGTVSILDVSHFTATGRGWSVRGMLVGLFARKIYHERLIARKSEEFEVMGGDRGKTIPMVWIIVDEAHMFIPSEGSTVASEPLLTLVKQGREPGISLLFITQIPNKLHSDALAQSDLVISHRLTAEADLKSLRSIMQSYMMEDIEKYINTLPRQRGSAIILDDNSERVYTIQIRPRFCWHAGGSPAAIKKEGLLE
ncbi:MAG: ATP-binding protein, partial [Candidatus Aenigmatarchaeota archaeon]